MRISVSVGDYEGMRCGSESRGGWRTVEVRTIWKSVRRQSCNYLTRKCSMMWTKNESEAFKGHGGFR